MSEEPHRWSTLNLMGSGELHPEMWRHAPVVQHDVEQDGADVQVLLQRWRTGGQVRDCLPPGKRAASAEVRRLREDWAERYAGASEVALWFAEWMEAQVRAEYGPPVFVRVSRDHRLRRVRRRQRAQPKKDGE